MNTFFQQHWKFKASWNLKTGDFVLIGGVAVLGRGEIRMTQYLNITLLTGFGTENILFRN